MKILYIDLETTGLSWIHDQVLEVGCLLDDLRELMPVEVLPRLRLVIKRDRYHGQPIALSMHNRLLAQIGMNDPSIEPYVCRDVDVAGRIADWLSSLLVSNYRKLTVGGKNVAGFDLNFLSELPGFWREGSKLAFGQYEIRQRVVDPGILYFDPLRDGELPNTDECCRRAGLGRSTDHTALGDCELVCQLVRHAVANGYFRPAA